MGLILAAGVIFAALETIWWQASSWRGETACGGAADGECGRQQRVESLQNYKTMSTRAAASRSAVGAVFVDRRSLARLADLGIQLHLHTVDRFASADNCLLPWYNSLHADLRAEAEDCYSQDWSDEVNWCHPSINCLDQLVHFLRESPAAATVVPPYWPGKAWFRELLTLAGDYRLIGSAAALADQQYLSRFKLRPPWAWPLVTFVIRA
eukprot:COSAG06_NODE_45_length_29559_cov_23.840835_21_plen_209_part_00